MSPFGSTRIWRGILRSVATAVIVNPAGTVGVSPFQPWGFAIFIGGTSVSSIFGSLGFLPVWSSFRSEEHTSELQSLMRISYAVFCLKKQKSTTTIQAIYFHSSHHH